MTIVDGVIKILRGHGGKADWKTIYSEIETHCPEAKKSKYWKDVLRGIVYREKREYDRNFIVTDGVVALKEKDSK